MSTDKPKYCPYCASEKISIVGYRNNEPIYVCFDCRDGFRIVLEAKDVVKGRKEHVYKTREI